MVKTDFYNYSNSTIDCLGYRLINCAHLSRYFKSLLLSFLLLTALTGTARSDDTDYSEFTLEDLMDISITSVSKREQQISRSAAAVHVVSAEEIAKRGVTTIPEVLKLIPGVLVSQINATLYEVSIRGFRRRFNNKLLVLIDGRSIYTPFFAGVYWEFHHLPVEEIDRIETIRGPGAALWGANAVNGVINIITKSAAKTTQTKMLKVQLGDQENIITTQQGADLPVLGSARFYGQLFDREDSDAGREDAYEIGKAGVKFHKTINHRIEMNTDIEFMEKENYQGSTNSFYTPPYSYNIVRKIKGKEGYINHIIRGSWGSHQLSLRSFIDHREREEELALTEDRTILSTELQHDYHWNTHSFIWGVGYRKDKDEFDNTSVVWVMPEKTSLETYNAFFQAQLKLSSASELTLGSKWEKNPFSGDEVQPNIRFVQQINEQNVVWAAVSQAVQTPSRALSDLSILVSVFPGDLPGVPAIPGLPELNALIVKPLDNPQSEEVTAWEMGWRSALSARISLDISMFFNRYEDVRDSELDYRTPALNVLEPIPHNEIYFSTRSDLKAEAKGLEVFANWSISEKLGVNASYSYLDLDYEAPIGAAFSVPLAEQESPNHLGFLTLDWQVNDRLNLYSSVRYVDEFLSSYGSGAQEIDASIFTDASLRISMPSKLTIQISVNNLFDSKTRESYRSEGVEVSEEIRRSGRIVFQYDW